MEFERNFLGEHIVMGILPWFHAFGIIVSIIMAVNTSKIVFLPKFEEKHFLRCIEVIEICTFKSFEDVSLQSVHFSRTKPTQSSCRRRFWLCCRRVNLSINMTFQV